MSAMAQIQRSMTAARDQKKYTNTDGPGGTTIDYGPGQQDPRFAGGAAPFGTSPWYGRNGEANPMPWSGPPGQSVGQRAPRYTPDAGDPRNAGYYVPTPSADQQAATDARNQAFRDAGAARLAGNAGYQQMLQKYQAGQLSIGDLHQATTRANLGLDPTQLYNPNQGWPTPTMADGTRAPGAPSMSGGGGGGASGGGRQMPPPAQTQSQQGNPWGAPTAQQQGGGGMQGAFAGIGQALNGSGQPNPALYGALSGAMQGNSMFTGYQSSGGMQNGALQGAMSGAMGSYGGGGVNGNLQGFMGAFANGGAQADPRVQQQIQAAMQRYGGASNGQMNNVLGSAPQQFDPNQAYHGNMRDYMSTGQASASPYGGGSNYGSFGPQMLGDPNSMAGFRTGPTFDPGGGRTGPPPQPVDIYGRPTGGGGGGMQPFQQQPYGGPMPYDMGGGMMGFAGFSPYGGGMGGQGYGGGYGQPMNQGYGAPQGYGGGYGGGYGSYGY